MGIDVMRKRDELETSFDKINESKRTTTIILFTVVPWAYKDKKLVTLKITSYI